MGDRYGLEIERKRGPSSLRYEHMLVKLLLYGILLYGTLLQGRTSREIHRLSNSLSMSTSRLLAPRRSKAKPWIDCHKRKMEKCINNRTNRQR